MKAQGDERAKLFCGIIYPNEKNCKKALAELAKKFGAVEAESTTYDFTKFTDYYGNEIGRKLNKKFVVFRKMISSDKLAEIKCWTNRIEDKHALKGKRVFNLDPGYFTMHKLVLGSMKSRAHKIYLGKGAYADLILLFGRNNAIEFEWTFPDFKSAGVKMFFAESREKLKKELNSGKKD